MTVKQVQAEALKPCPFCGGTFVAQGASNDRISVWCGDCGARGPDSKFPENCMPGPPIDECRAAWNRRAALPEAPAVPVVKALEWRKGDGETISDNVSVAEDGFGSYYAIAEQQWWRPNVLATLCGSDEEAFAAAQADFEARIRAALVATPPAPTAAVDGEVQELLGEGLEILTNLVDNITRRGNYSPEATCMFIDQAGACVREAVAALKVHLSPGTAEEEK